MTDDFDAVGLAEIALMRNPPMSKQLALDVMRRPGAPEGTRLARGMVYPRREAEKYIAGLSWAGGPLSAEALEAREWLASGRAREMRVAAGVAQAAVAAELGVSQQTVARWELGGHVPAGGHAAAYHALLTRLAAGLDGR